MGSVKDLKIWVPARDIIIPGQSMFGIGVFDFSDRYSVFDWGEMPDHIWNKGAALAMMSAINFELLEQAGIQTHYVGMIDTDGKIKKLKDLKAPSGKMVVYLANVRKPVPYYEDIDDLKKITSHDYSEFAEKRGQPGCFVVPLECIYRNGAPGGSSLFKKIAKAQKEGNQTYIVNLLQRTGLTSVDDFVPGVRFPKPIYDFSTKYEETGDRTLTDEDARYISGITEDHFRLLGETRNTANKVVADAFERVGLQDEDGKLEFVYFMPHPESPEGVIYVGDVLGTLDENRITLNGEQASKQIPRDWYKANQPTWVAAVEEAKATGREDWKSICREQPVNLPPQLVSLVSAMYKSTAQRCLGLHTGRTFFEVPELEKVLADLRPYRN